MSSMDRCICGTQPGVTMSTRFGKFKALVKCSNCGLEAATFQDSHGLASHAARQVWTSTVRDLNRDIDWWSYNVGADDDERNY